MHRDFLALSFEVVHIACFLSCIKVLIHVGDKASEKHHEIDRLNEDVYQEGLVVAQSLMPTNTIADPRTVMVPDFDTVTTLQAMSGSRRCNFAAEETNLVKLRCFDQINKLILFNLFYRILNFIFNRARPIFF